MFRYCLFVHKPCKEVSRRLYLELYADALLCKRVRSAQPSTQNKDLTRLVCFQEETRDCSDSYVVASNPAHRIEHKMPRNGNVLVVESVLSSGNAALLRKSEVEDLVSAIRENLKLKSSQNSFYVCGQQRHARYSPYVIPKRNDSGFVSSVSKDVLRLTCVNDQQEADKDPYELLQQLLRKGTLIQEAVRRLQHNDRVVEKSSASYSVDSSCRELITS